MSDIDGDEGPPPQDGAGTAAASHGPSAASRCPSAVAGSGSTLLKVGALSFFFIVAFSNGLLKGSFKIHDCDAVLDDGVGRIVGIVLGRWCFFSPREYANSMDESILALGKAAHAHTKRTVHGFVAWEVLEKVELNYFLDVALGFNPSVLWKTLLDTCVCVNHRGTYSDHAKLSVFVSRWRDDYGLPWFPLYSAWLLSPSLITYLNWAS
jgi:hypothetical protein